jgi:hypothetical protein
MVFQHSDSSSDVKRINPSGTREHNSNANKDTEIEDMGHFLDGDIT